MTSLQLQASAIEALVVLNAAIKNIRLYPPTSAMVQKSIERVLTSLEAIYKTEDTLTVAESEKSLLIFGSALTEKEQQKPQVMAFTATLLDFGIKSLAFNKGVTLAEVETFLVTLSRKPEEIASEGGLAAVLASANLAHIVLDEKVYVAMDKGQSLSSGMDTAGAEIVKFIASGEAASEEEMEKLKELAKDPNWVANVFTAGITQLNESGQHSGKNAPEVARTVDNLINTFETLTDSESKAAISKQVADTVVDQDDDTIAAVIARDYEGDLGGDLSAQVIDRMKDEQFEKLVLKMKNRATTGDATASAAFQNLAISEKGQRLSGNIKKREDKSRTLKKRKIMQLRANLNSLVKGDLAQLNDADLLESLPNMTAQLMAKGKQETANTILERLTAGLTTGAPEPHRQIFKTLDSISQKLNDEQKADLASKTAGNLLHWAKSQSTLSPEYETASEQLKEQARNLFKKRNFGQFNIIIGVFNEKLTGKGTTDKTLRQHAGATLQEIGDETAWDLLLNKFALLEKRLQEPAIQSQVLLGIVAMDTLLDALKSSPEMRDRVRLVRIITEIGEPAISKICTRIEKGGPWYYLRNLVALLGKIGGPDQVAVLKPLLDHKDFRIQRETLNSLYIIGGEQRGPLLLANLPTAPDEIKISIVAMLGALKHQESVTLLLDILGSKAAADAKLREHIFEKACVALGRIGSQKAVPELEKVSQGKGLLKKAYTPRVREAARNALVLIEKAAAAKPPPQPEQPKQSAQPEQPAPAPPAKKAKKPKPQNDQREAQVDKLVAAGDTDAAVKLVFELLVEAAKQKNFKKAEALRDKLYDVDAMALTEIVKAGEIIEQEKTEAIDQDHLDVWPDLYDKLSDEEANTLFHAMEEVSYETNQTIFAQGGKNENLYFITQGRLKLAYQDGKRENLLKTLEKGDLAGYGTFFTISMCTTSLITLSSVKMSVLSKSSVAQWEKEAPALESKLQDYCMKLERSRDVIRKKGMDRRKQQRFNVKGKILVQLQNQKGQSLGKPFKGEFSDISEGGLSFFIITAKRETARMLLGRRLGVTFLIPTPAAPLKTFQNGTVICVNYHLKNDYSIHVSFDDDLPAGIAGAVKRLKNIKT